MAHDVFISYSSKDKPTADAVCGTLEGKRIRCWMAPRDVLPGLPWGEAIVEAIEASRVVVLVFSASANKSPHVMREVERAVRKGIPIIPFRIEEVPPAKALGHFISSLHWLDALTPPREKHLQSLAETVHLLLVRKAALIRQETAEETSVRLPSANTMLEAPLLLEENDSDVNRRVGQTLGTVAVPPPLPTGQDDGIEVGIVVPTPVPPWRRALIVSGLAGLLLAVLVSLILMFNKRGGGHIKEEENKPLSPTPRIEFKGQSNWRLRARQGTQVPLKGLPLGAPGALYLRGGDHVVFQAELTQGPEAYFYVLQIDVRGVAWHLYPPGWSWKDLPQGEKARTVLRLPQSGDSPLEDSPSGLESLLWLVRTKPLTREENAQLEKLLTPPELAWEQPKKIQQLREDEDLDLDPFLVENGQIRDHRGHLLLGQQRIAKDPLGQTEKVTLAIRDQQLAQYSRAMCYLFLDSKAVKAK